jgi:hypothetical protein
MNLLILALVLSVPAVEPANMKPAAPPVTIPNAGKDAFIGPLKIVPPGDGAACGINGCSYLQAEAHTDAVVFFLEHQAKHGLVRLAGNECRNRTSARIARTGEVIQLPIAQTTTDSRDWSETLEWNRAPELDTYYAIAVSDAAVARRVANHMDALPQRCLDAIHPGLTGDELDAWLDDFAMLTAHAARQMDWRGLEVHDAL